MARVAATRASASSARVRSGSYKTAVFTPNIGAPDLNAQYLYAPLDGLGGSQIEITGAYPHARYFSFTLYGNDQQAETSIYDQQIAPDRGSYNPFNGPGRAGEQRNYTVHVLFENAPKQPAPRWLWRL